MSPVIETTGLSLGYNGQNVLEDVNLAVSEGDFWFFLGVNGSGKTTLIRGLLGDLTPRRGGIEFNRQLAGRERIGFVPQRCDLNSTLSTTIREFVLLGTVGLRLTRSEETNRLSWALERVGLGGQASRDYWSLSGGQRQRALVARALVRRPGLLILDEPVVGLDLPGREALLESLSELNREENITVLFVTHNLTSAVRHASHVALFLDGRLLAGSAAEVLTSENLSRTYGVPVTVTREPSGNVSVMIEKTG